MKSKLTSSEIKERKRRYLKKYFFINRNKIKDYRRKYRQINKLKIYLYNRKYVEQHSEKSSLWSRRYRENNHEKSKENTRKWSMNNKDKVKIKGTRWRRNNPIRAKLLVWKRLQRIKNIKHEFTQKQWKYKLNLTKGFCVNCQNNVGINNLQIDHIIPISKVEKGHVYTIDDVQPLCRSCNCSKADKVF